MNNIEIYMFIITASTIVLCSLQLMISIEALKVSKTISYSVEKESLQKIIDHMVLAENAKDTLNSLKTKYPDIDFGVSFYDKK